MLERKAKDDFARQKAFDIERNNTIAEHKANNRSLETTIEAYAKDEEILRSQNLTQQQAHVELIH